MSPTFSSQKAYSHLRSVVTLKGHKYRVFLPDINIFGSQRLNRIKRLIKIQSCIHMQQEPFNTIIYTITD